MTKKYESLRNGAIGTVISENENEVVLDFDGTQKTVKMSNLKRWYKPCGIVDEKELEEAKEMAKKKAKLDARVNDPNKPNGDLPPKEECSQLANKIISYLEKKGCLTKKTCSYTRVRLEGHKRNIMEVWWGKRLIGIKVVVRSEAILPHKELAQMGRTVPPTHMYVLDHIFKFNNSSKVEEIYKIIDIVVEFEKNYKPKTTPNKQKNGTGKINGKQSLKSKREVLGIKSDDELAKEQEELANKTEELEKEIANQPVAIES
jgi:hypothetical protein